MFVVRLPATWEELHAALPRNIRESLRKCRNSLTRDSLTPAFHVLTDVNAIRSSLPAFFDLHRNRALATDTVHHNDVFRRPEDRAFLAGVVDHLAPGGMVRMFQMEIGGKIVAMRLGIACHESLYLYYSGYDTAWAKYSVMTSVNAYAIQYAISMGFRTVNLSTGSDQAKLRWRPEEIPTISVRIHRRTLRTMGTQRALDFARAFRSRVRSARASTG